MRRCIRFLAILLPWVLLAQQQRVGTSIELPADPDIGVYYRRGTGWEEMLPEVVNWKTGGVLKQLATAGFVKGDQNGHLNGIHSRNLLTSPIVVIYAPEGVAVTEYQLLQLRENSGSREFRTITGGVMHVSGGATRDVIPFEGRRLARGVYEVLMPKLASGEYGFLAPGAVVSRNSASIGKIYTFRVNVPKGTALTSDTRGEVTLAPAKPTAKPVSVQPPAAAATLPSDSQASNVGGSARLPVAPTSAQPSLKPMTNHDVIELKLAGFTDEFVIGKIKASPASYRIDKDDIIALKKSNLSEPVIQTMMAAAASDAGPTPPGTLTRTVPAPKALPTVNGPHTAAGQDAPAEQADPATRGTSEPPSKGLFTKLKGAFSSSSNERKPRTNQTAPPEPAVPPELALTSLTVLSTPAGATILVDGYPAGRTPAVVKLVPGTYKLTLKAGGFPDYSQQVTVEPGQVRSFGVALDGSK